MSGLNSIVFNKGEGGLGAPLPGEDQYSALLFYSDTLPSGFSSSDRIKKIFSVADAEDLGITVDSHGGETVATATCTVTGAGAANDTIKLTLTEDDGTIVDLGTATVPATPTTTTVATAIAAAINAGTATHGYTAVGAVAVVTITAPAGSGTVPNNSTLAKTIVGTATATLAQFSGGVGSIVDIMHYHISEYFRIQPKGVIWVGVYATAGVGTFSEITTMQNFASGKIRQMGIYQKGTASTTGHTTTIQSICTALDTAKMPLSVIMSWEMSGTANVSSLSTLRGLSNSNVSVTIGQDGAADGFQLWRRTGKSIGMVGTTLGAVALAKVNESIEWVAKFNIAATEFETLAFANGQKYSDISTTLLGTLNDYGYVFGIKYVMINGSYFSGSNTCIATTSDYAKIENVRTIDKADRSIYAFMLPALGSPLTVDADGKLSLDTIGYFESLANRAIEQMQRDGEVSTFQVIINPDQDVLSSGELVVTEEIVPKGVARRIVNNIGYVTKLS